MRYPHWPAVPTRPPLGLRSPTGVRRPCLPISRIVMDTEVEYSNTIQWISTAYSLFPNEPLEGLRAPVQQGVKATTVKATTEGDTEGSLIELYCAISSTRKQILERYTLNSCVRSRTSGVACFPVQGILQMIATSKGTLEVPRVVARIDQKGLVG